MSFCALVEFFIAQTILLALRVGMIQANIEVESENMRAELDQMKKE